VAVLLVFIAFGAMWKAKSDVQGLNASHRALEIEIANYRAAVKVLIEQTASQKSSTSGLDTAPARPSAPDRFDPASGKPLMSSVPPPSAPATRAAESQPHLSPPTLEPVQAAAARGSMTDSDAAARAALTGALAGLSQARALAETANAPVLASGSYQAGLAVEVEARELSTSGRVTGALVQAEEANARFRAAEVEARAEAAALERLRVTDPIPVRPLLAAGREVPPPLVDPPGELRQPLQTSVPPLGTDVERTIQEVIAQYVNGLESRNLATLKRVWPSLGGTQERAIQTEFENARTVQTLFTDPRITVNGDITIVTGLRMYSLVTQDGQRLSSLTRTTMTLRRSGDAWVIERVAHQQ
jgi:hypothetical protein